jgi:alkanesulfonate monooxygenase SsuD/methylene tetrahydromethanopterin reductase-like flavin-dependent oxidoreductase (luciferase family)
VRFVCNLNDARVQPVEWADARQAEGWAGFLVCDHLWDPAGPRPHVWSLLGALAASTRDVTIGTGFVNNLFRHPVEFAQASLTMQRISGGRFEAGLGAGWSADELMRTGRPMVPARERADRLIEAVQLVRELFDTGSSHFDGRHYRLDVDRLERLGDQRPPTLVVGAGGPRVIRSVAPFVDKLEIMPPAVATRSGTMDLDVSNAVTLDDVRALVDLARSTREDLPLRLYVACCAGDDERTQRIAEMFPSGFFAQFYGSPSKVADAILSLGELGIDEFHLAPNDQYTYENLAPLLLNGADRPPA